MEKETFSRSIAPTRSSTSGSAVSLGLPVAYWCLILSRSSSVHLILSISLSLILFLTGHDHRPSRSSFPQVQLLNHAGRSLRLVIRHTCITGTSRAGFGLGLHSSATYPLALLIIRGIFSLSASGQADRYYSLLFIYLSLRIIFFFFCFFEISTNGLRSGAGTRNTVARQGHVQTHHRIIVIASERSHTSSHPHHPILLSLYCV